MAEGVNPRGTMRAKARCPNLAPGSPKAEPGERDAHSVRGRGGGRYKVRDRHNVGGAREGALPKFAPGELRRGTIRSGTSAWPQTPCIRTHRFTFTSFSRRGTAVRS